MDMNSLLVVAGGVLLGAAIVWLLSRTFSYFKPRRDRDRVVRLEVRARTLHEHVHHPEGGRPYTAEEVSEVLFGEDASKGNPQSDEEENERKEGRPSED